MTPVRIRLLWHPQPQFAGYLLAQHEGYAAARDIALTCVPMDGSAGPIEALRSGACEFAVASPAHMLESDAPEELVMLLAVQQTSALCYGVHRAAGIASASDLAGKRIAVWPGGEDLELRWMLQRAHVPAGAATLVPVNDTVAALANGDVDGAQMTTYHEVFELEHRVDSLAAYAFLDAASYGAALLKDGLFARRRWVAEHPDLVQAVIDAVLEGWTVAFAQPEVAIGRCAALRRHAHARPRLSRPRPPRRGAGGRGRGRRAPARREPRRVRRRPLLGRRAGRVPAGRRMSRQVVVVGAGIVGAAVAAALARRGHAVRLFEQHDPGSAVSGGSLACLSTHMVDEDEIPALRWACDAWAALAAEQGAALEYRRCGQIRFLERADQRPLAAHWVAAERAHGLQPELLEPDAVRAIEPALEGPIVAATFAPDDALVNPFFAVRAYVNDARAHGAAIRSHAAVTAIESDGARVTGVRAGGERIACDTVVVAAGPWSARLAATAGVDLPIVPRKAQCCATVAQPPTIRAVVGACKDAGGVHSGYTQIQQMQSGQICFNTVLPGGVEGAAHFDAIPEIDRTFLRDSVAMLVRLFPRLRDVELLRSWVRYEAVTPDDRFLIGPAGPAGLFVAAGDGGVGFVRAPAIGRAIADMLDGTASPFRTDIYDPGRFAAAVHPRPASGVV
jgi:sarcosine oxidase subunit beta